MYQQNNITTNVGELSVELRKNDFLRQFDNYVLWLATQDDLEAARAALRVVEPAIGQIEKTDQIDTKQRFAYNRLLQLLRAICLPFLRDEETESFFKGGLSAVFATIDIDLLSKLQAKIQRIYMHDERDIFRSKLRSALLGNTEFFSEMNTGNSLSIATVLKDYEQAIGGVADSFVRERYLTESPLIRSMQQVEREKIRRLTSIYAELKLSSLTPEGVEEKMSFVEDGKHLVLDRGQVMEIPTDPDPILKALLDAESKNFKGTQETPFQARKVPVPRPVVAPVTPQPTVAPPEPFQGPVTPAPTTIKRATPAFMVDRDDEVEVDRFRNKNLESGSWNLEQELRAYIDKFIKAQNLSFKDAGNERRFMNLFVSRLKGVRSTVDVREILQKPVEVGGLGIAGEALERVVKLVEMAFTEWQAKPRELVNLVSHEVVAPLVVNPVMTTPTEPPGRAAYTPPGAAQVEVISEKLEVGVGTDEPVTLPAQDEHGTRHQEPSFDRAKAEEWRQRMLHELAAKAAEQGAGGRVESGVNIFDKGKLTMADVKAPPKVLGPLEELKSMTLIDMRRLAPTTVEQLTKVRQKIELIGETSITRRLEAIRAWQASDVYQLYLKMGRKSIEQGKSISELAALATSLGELALIESEFNAIVDFNARLRF